jgi:TP901 family phage tail tape measure protein
MAGELKVSGDEFKKVGFAAAGAAQKTAMLGRDLTKTAKSTKAISTATKEIKQDLSEYAKWAGNASNQTKRYQYAQAEMTKVTGRTTGAIKNATAQLNRADKAIYNHAQNMKASNAVKKRFYERTSRMAVMEREAAGAIRLTSRGIERITTATDKATVAKNKTITASGKVVASTKKVAAATKKASTSMVGYNKQIAKVEGAMNRLYAAMRVTVSYGIAASAIYAVINALKVGVQEIVLFDQGLKNLQAITGATSAQIAIMGETMKDVARTTKFSTSEISDGMVLLGQAGFSAEESLAAIKAVSMLATATLTDMTETTDLLTTTIRAFGLQAMEASRVADIMANAVNKSKLTIDKLRTAFAYIAASASQAGLSVEEVAATMAVLANNGLRASKIGTGFRQVLARLIAPNERLREAFMAQGIAINKINPIVVGYEKTLENLTKVLINLETKTVDMGKAYSLFGLRGSQSAAIIVKSFLSGEYQQALNQMDEFGTAAKMAGIQAEGLQLSLKNLGDRAKLAAVALGKRGLASSFKMIIDMLKDLATGFELFIKSSIGGTIIEIGVLTVVVAGLVKVLSLLSLRLGVIAAEFVAVAIATGSLKKSFAWLLGPTVLTNPFVLGAAAIAAYALAIKKLISRNRHLAQSASENAVVIQEEISVLEGYRDILRDLEYGSVKYLSAIKRLSEEFPDLTEEILVHTDAVDLSTIAYGSLKEAMDEIAVEKAKVKMDELTEAMGRQIKEIERSSGSGGWWRALGKSFKNIGKELEATNEILEKYSKSSDKARKRTYDYKEMLISQSKTLTDQITKYGATKKEIFAFIDAMDQSTALAKYTGRTLKENITKELERIAIAAKKAEELLNSMGAFMDKLPPKFKAAFDKLDALGKVRFMKAMKQMEKEIVEYEKSAKILKKNKLMTEEEIAAGVEAIRQQTLNKFIEKADIEIETTRRFQNILKELPQTFTDVYNKIDATKKLDFINTIKRMDQEIAKAKETAIKAGVAEKDRVKIINSIRAETLSKLKEMLAQEEVAYDTHFERLKNRHLMLLGDRESVEQSFAQSRYQRSISSFENEFADKENFTNKMAIFEKQAAEILETELFAIKIKYAQKSREEELKYHRIRIDAAKSAVDEQLYNIEISEKEANEKKLELEIEFAQLVLDSKTQSLEEAKALYAEDTIAYKQAINEKLEAEQNLTQTKQKSEEIKEPDVSWTKRFSQGLIKAKNDSDSLGDTWEKIGGQIVDVIATNMTDGIFDFIEGTKSAKDAFIDFAKSTLKWIAQIIMKQAIMRALGGLGAGAAHTGAIIGQSNLPTRQIATPPVDMIPKLHDGLMPKEFVTILKEGEGVFTPEQMKVMSMKMAGDKKEGVSLTLNIPVNVSQEDLKGLGIKIKSRIEDTVRRTLQEELAYG